MKKDKYSYINHTIYPLLRERMMLCSIATVNMITVNSNEIKKCGLLIQSGFVPFTQNAELDVQCTYGIHIRNGINLYRRYIYWLKK